MQICFLGTLNIYLCNLRCWKEFLKRKTQIIVNWNRVDNIECRIRLLFLCGSNVFTTKTCLYNFDPTKPHFYIVKLGFTGVYIIFVLSAQNLDCGYTLEPPRQGGSNEYPQSMFWAETWKISDFLSENVRVSVVKKCFIIFELACFRNMIWYL